MTAYSILLCATVAPRAGAWIETSSLWVCTWSSLVAPRAGAWIETGNEVKSGGIGDVAPRAGAWIETPDLRGRLPIGAGRPSRRGVD